MNKYFVIKIPLRYLLLILVILSGLNCGKKTINKIEPMVEYKNKDEKQIHDSIIKYIQYYKDNPKEYEVEDFFSLYSHYDVNITIDTMIYRPDSLVAFVFFAIKNNSKAEYKYSGRALMAYRQTKDDVMQIYPITEYNTFEMSTYSDAIGILELLYMNRLGKQSDNYGDKFNSNVGSKDFWEKSLYLKKVNDGQYYYFQTHLKYGTANELGYIPYHYPKCK